MKKLMLGLIILLTANVYAQTPAPVSSFPVATGKGEGSFLYTIQGGISKKILTDSISKQAKNYADSVAALKQAALVSATNIKTVNGNSLLGAGDVVISSASIKPLYRDLIVSSGSTTWNFDSSSTARAVTAGTLSLSITGAVPIGSTGVLVVTQSGAGGDSLKYNGSLINIAKQPNKNSLVGFVKVLNNYIFSVDTTNISIAQSGSFDPSAQALFAAAGTNSSYQTAVNNAIVALKGINLTAGGTAWSKSVMINGRAGTSLLQQSYNWKDPTTYNYIYNGTFVYNANGTKFDGSVNYINTNIIPSTSFVGTTTDVSLFTIISQATTVSGAVIGAIDQTNNRIFGHYFTPTVFEYALNTPNVDITIAAQLGRYLTSYTNATTLASYKNGALLDSRTVTPNTIPINFSMYEGAYNTTTAAAIYRSDALVGVTQVINSKLTASEAAQIDAVWLNYQTALGR